MHLPRAYIYESRFLAAVDRVAKSLAPDVVRIITEFGPDWTGQDAVFLMTILTDEAARHERILAASNRVEEAIYQQVRPLERWGVFPYFNFRGQSAQAAMEQRISV